MAIENKQVQVAKEVDDVCELLVKVVSDVRAGKPVADIVSGSVAPLVQALSGVDQVGAELQANRKVALATVGSRLGELVDAILGPDVPANP